MTLLLILDPVSRRSKARGQLLLALFGVTPGEATVAEAAIRGESAAEIAGRRGASEATVRTQSRQMLAKTGADSLRRLAARAAALPRGPSTNSSEPHQR